MAVDNRTIETNKETKDFVIVVQRNGIKKFIDKNWYSKKHINCSVIITRAKRFNTKIAATSFYKEIEKLDHEVSFVGIFELKIEYSVYL